MTVTRLFPILRTADLPRLSGFYDTAFGAAVTYRYDQDGVDVYRALAVGEGSIGIGVEPDVERGRAIAVWMYVDDVDSAFERAVGIGAEPVAAPEALPWGERVAQIHDPDGNLLYLAAAAAER